MADTKQHYYIAGLILVGGAVVLYYLWKQAQIPPTSPSEGSVQPPDIGQEISGYPSSNPINLGDVTIVSGASPASSYNLAHAISGVSATDPYGTGGACCDQDECEQVGYAVTVQRIDPKVIEGAQDNLLSYQHKITSDVEAARVNDSEHAATVQRAIPVKSVSVDSSTGTGQRVGFSAA
jgi:hypothetical protein